MNKPSLVAAALVALLSLALLGGCGGDDEGDGGANGTAASAESPAGGGGGGEAGARANAEGGSGAGGASGDGKLSKAELIKRGDVICDQGQARIGREIDSHLGVPGGIEAAAPGLVKEVLVPRLEEQIRRLRALEASPDAAPAVDAVTEALQDMIDRAQAEPAGFIVDGEAAAASEQTGRKQGFSSCGALV